MITKFIWNATNVDYECCLQSVASVLDLGVTPSDCTVLITRGRELDEVATQKFTDLGVAVREGLYTRRNKFTDVVARFNECIVDGADVVWHLDSDVIVNNLKPLEYFHNSDVVALAAAIPTYDFYGCSFIMKCSAATTCLADLLEHNTADLPPSAGFADDKQMGMVLDSVYGRSLVARITHADQWCYRFDKEWSSITRVDWVHFGQRALARQILRMDNHTSLGIIAEHMQLYREWRKTHTS